MWILARLAHKQEVEDRFGRVDLTGPSAAVLDDSIALIGTALGREGDVGVAGEGDPHETARPGASHSPLDVKDLLGEGDLIQNFRGGE